MAHSSIRFSLGRFNTTEEVDYAVEQTVKAVTELREMSPLYEMALEQQSAGAAAPKAMAEDPFAAEARRHRGKCKEDNIRNM